jgi:exosortase B
MSGGHAVSARTGTGPPSAILPAGADLFALGFLVLGFAALYLPTYLDLARRIWPGDEQGHGPIILCVSLWLLYSLRHDVAALPIQPAKPLGVSLLVAGVALYALGRSQGMLVFEVLSQSLVLVGLVLWMLGRAALRKLWFPLFFLLFMVPLPGSIVVWLTGPLKAAVSAVAANLLHALGYPVARAGVILSVGQYQLLVADACAGLNSMFTLEALGLLYLNLARCTSARRNLALALLIIPIAFLANIIRVMILVLVTYHFGDAAGQGFVHSFSGMVLFMAGLSLMLAADKLLLRVFKNPEPAPVSMPGLAKGEPQHGQPGAPL